MQVFFFFSFLFLNLKKKNIQKSSIANCNSLLSKIENAAQFYRDTLVDRHESNKNNKITSFSSSFLFLLKKYLLLLFFFIDFFFHPVKKAKEEI